jgi:hypothetical protein
MLQMLKESPVKLVSFEMTCSLKPCRVRRDVMSGIKAEAANDLPGYFDAFLSGVGVERMKAAQFRNEGEELGKLPRYNARSAVT